MPVGMDSAPKDRRIIAYGKHGFEPDKGWATVKWDSFRKAFFLDPNEATEYDPEESKCTHWLNIPDPPPSTSFP